MSRLDNALRNLGRATLLQDETLRLRAMNELLHLAGVGSDVLNGSPPQSSLFRPFQKRSTEKRSTEKRGAAPKPVWYEHEDVRNVGRSGRHMRGTIDGKGAQLYVSTTYISMARHLHRFGRCGFRPAKGPGGKPAAWLTDEEAATVRAEIAARWPKESA